MEDGVERVERSRLKTVEDLLICELLKQKQKSPSEKHKLKTRDSSWLMKVAIESHIQSAEV